MKEEPHLRTTGCGIIFEVGKRENLLVVVVGGRPVVKSFLALTAVIQLAEFNFAGQGS